MRTGVSVVAIVLAAVMACSSRYAASEANFRKAINAYFARHCIALNERFPVEMSMPRDGARASPEAARLDTLVATGILTVRQAQMNVPVGLHSEGYPLRVYELTELGKRFYSEEMVASGSIGSLCAGTNEVDSIETHSEPEQTWGFMVTRVQFTYSPKNVNDWARDRWVQDAFPELKILLATKQAGEEELVLTGAGWVHQEDVRAAR